MARAAIPEQPPHVPAQPAVEGPGGDEPGQGRRVAQTAHAGQPRGVRLVLPGQVLPDPGGHRRIGRRRGTVRAPRATGAVGSVGLLARLDPHEAHPRRGVEPEVDRTGLLHPQGGQGRHRGRVGVVARLVGAVLADDPSLVLGGEPAHGVPEPGMRAEGPTALLQGRPGTGEVEEVAGDHQDPGAVPAVEDQGQLARDGERRRGGLGGEEQIAHHHDPAADGDVHRDHARVLAARPFGHCGIHRGGDQHGPGIVRAGGVVAIRRGGGAGHLVQS